MSSKSKPKFNVKNTECQCLIVFTLVIMILGLVFTTQCGSSDKRIEHMESTGTLTKFFRDQKMKVADALSSYADQLKKTT